jgi:hypothetical protein
VSRRTKGSNSSHDLHERLNKSDQLGSQIDARPESINSVRSRVKVTKLNLGQTDILKQPINLSSIKTNMNRHQEKLEKNEKVDRTNSPKFKIKSVVSDGISENGTMIPAETKLRRHNPLRCRFVKKYTRTVENEMVKIKIKLPRLKK